MENDKRMDTYVKNNDNIICEFTTDLLDFVVISQHSKKKMIPFLSIRLILDFIVIFQYSRAPSFVVQSFFLGKDNLYLRKILQRLNKIWEILQ